jgi:hypothetical protein
MTHLPSNFCECKPTLNYTETGKRNNTFDLVVTDIGIVGCGKIKIQKYPSREEPCISNGAEQWHPYSVSLDFECLLKKIKNTKIRNTTYRVIKKDCLSWQYN